MPGMTTISATNLCDSSGNKISNATISFQPCNNDGAPLSFRVNGSGQVIRRPISTQVASGAFSLDLADTSLTSPVNIGFLVTVIDNVSGNVLLGGIDSGYIIQPTGATWSFDAFVPNLPALATFQPGIQGESAYQVAVDNGFVGSEAAWLLSLNGGAPNIFFDSFNRYTQSFPTLNGWTWYPLGAPTFTTASANIPVTSPVAQIPSGTQFSKQWDFTKLGMAIGDTITVSALAYFATSSGGKITITFYNASNTQISATASANSLVSGVQTVSKSATVPAGTAYIRITVSDGSGASAFEVAGVFAAKGNVQPSLSPTEASLSYTKAWLDANYYGGYGVKTTQSGLAIDRLAPVVKNLVDANDPFVVLGAFVAYNTGIVSTNASYNTTGYVPIVGGQTYTRSHAYQMAFFDLDLNYISGRNTTGTPGSPETFTAPSNAAYARFSVVTSSWNAFQVEAGSSATGYQPYARAISSSQIPITQTAGIADGAVTLAKTAFSATGKNKVNINASDVVLGQFINSANGQLVVNATYNATGYVPLVAGQTYTRSYAHQMAFYDTNKVYISGRPATGNPAVPETFTAPAGTAYARFTVITTFWNTFQVELGSSATSFEAYYLALDPNALPPGVNQATRLNGGLTDTGALIVNPYRANLLRQTHYKLMKLALQPTPEATQLIINLVGDSYTQGIARWSGPFAQHMIAKFGDAGGGFCGFGWNPAGTTNVPPWTIGNQPSYIGGNVRAASYPVVLLGNVTGVYNTAPSPNIASLGMAQAGDEVQVSIPATPVHNGCDLLFVGTSNGVIRYSWDNGTTWTSINVQGTAGAVQTAALTTGLPSGAGTLRIQWVSGTVTLCGVNLKSAASGVRINILAGTGSNISQWAGAAAGSLEAGWAALGAHLFIQMDGTNSQVAGFTASQWSTYLATLVGRMRAATPGVDILIVTPPENQLGNSIPMSSYANAARDFALANRVAYVDMQDAFGDPTNPTEYGPTGAVPLFASDNTHPDPLTGGRALLFQFLEAILPR